MFVSHVSLFKRGKLWYIQFVDVDGKRKQKSTRERYKEDALKKLTEFKQLLKVRPEPKSLAQFTDELFEFGKMHYAHKTQDKISGTLKSFECIIGNRNLSAITPKDIDEYKMKRLSCIKPVSLNCELRTLRSAFNIAMRWNYIQSNPFSKIAFIQIPESEPIFFTKNDFQLLLNAIKETWFKEIVLFAVLTGLRRGEIVNLKWENIDFDRRVIHIVSNATFITKQGKKRVVPMNDVCFHLLNSIYVRSTYELVFNQRGMKLYEDGLCHLLKKYVRELGLNDRLHFHSLRHSFASWLAQSNVSIYTLKELLGHSDVKTTQVYSHLVSNEMHNVVNKIDVGYRDKVNLN